MDCPGRVAIHGICGVLTLRPDACAYARGAHARPRAAAAALRLVYGMPSMACLWDGSCPGARAMRTSLHSFPCGTGLPLGVSHGRWLRARGQARPLDSAAACMLARRKGRALLRHGPKARMPWARGGRALCPHSAAAPARRAARGPCDLRWLAVGRNRQKCFSPAPHVARVPGCRSAAGGAMFLAGRARDLGREIAGIEPLPQASVSTHVR